MHIDDAGSSAGNLPASCTSKMPAQFRAASKGLMILGEKPIRRTEVIFGELPFARLLRQLEAQASAQARTGRDRRIGQNELNAPVGGFCGTDHAAALQTAELSGLQVDNSENLLSD